MERKEKAWGKGSVEIRAAYGSVNETILLDHERNG